MPVTAVGYCWWSRRAVPAGVEKGRENREGKRGKRGRGEGAAAAVSGLLLLSRASSGIAAALAAGGSVQ